jgi:hypothetical protein
MLDQGFFPMDLGGSSSTLRLREWGRPKCILFDAAVLEVVFGSLTSLGVNGLVMSTDWN